MNVLNMFETSGQIKSNYSTNDLNQKITFYVNVKYLIDPKSFVIKHSKSIKVVEKDLKDVRIGKCKKCYVIIPQPFINEEQFNENVIKTFEQKVKKRYLLYVSDMLNHQYFEKDNLETIDQLYEALKSLYDKLSKTKMNFEECQLIIRNIEEELNKGDINSNKLQNVLIDIQKHAQRKLKHYTIMNKAQKILLDFPDARDSLKNKLITINDDLSLAKNDLKEMKNSIEILEDKDRKEIELTHKKKDLIDYVHKDENIFRYRMVIPILFKSAGNSC